MRLALSGVVIGALALCGCASTPPASSLTPRSPVAQASSSFVPDPATREATHPDPNFDYGFVVQITASGFHPQTLLSACCKPVTWRNLTDQSISVIFDHQLVKSSLIPPGGTWVFVPRNPESITYHAGPARSGVLQVQQTSES